MGMVRIVRLENLSGTRKSFLEAIDMIKSSPEIRADDVTKICSISTVGLRKLKAAKIK